MRGLDEERRRELDGGSFSGYRLRRRGFLWSETIPVRA
jgi:hypothetical protein